MTKEVWFWIIYVLTLFFALYAEYQPNQPYPYPRGLRWFMLFVLIGILGWRVFGGPVK